MGRTIAGAGLMALLSFGACGQSATAPAVFEVASVMPSKSGIRGSPADFFVGERFTATNCFPTDMTLRQRLNAR